jgi:hypothetical protein
MTLKMATYNILIARMSVCSVVQPVLQLCRSHSTLRSGVLCAVLCVQVSVESRCLAMLYSGRQWGQALPDSSRLGRVLLSAQEPS